MDSQALLNWGFRFFETHKLYDAGKAIAKQKVWKGAADQVNLGVAEPMLVTVPRGRYAQLKPSMDVPKTLVAPIKQGPEDRHGESDARWQGDRPAPAGGDQCDRRGRFLQAPVG